MTSKDAYTPRPRCRCGRFGRLYYLLRLVAWPVTDRPPVPLTSAGPLPLRWFVACRRHTLDDRARASSKPVRWMTANGDPIPPASDSSAGPEVTPAP